jgi:predicted glycosyltransferase
MTVRPTVWLDLENAPQAWVLSLIAEHLRERGYRIVVTARDFSCTVALSRRLGFVPEVIGPHGPARHRSGKFLQVVQRGVRLALRVRTERDLVLAVGHGSRAQALASFLVRRRAVSLLDYEHVFLGFSRFVNHLLVPFPIPPEALAPYALRVVQYPGLKEELYLAGRVFNGLMELPPLDPESVLVLLRPGADSAHYQSTTTEALQEGLLDRLSGADGVGVVLIPRDKSQGERVASALRAHRVPVWVPSEVLDGPALIARMDLVLGGGGTMTREAAVLGVPAYTFFGGTWGAVDAYLEARGRLVRLRTAPDLSRVRFEKRTTALDAVSHHTLGAVVDWLDRYARTGNGAPMMSISSLSSRFAETPGAAPACTG